MVDLNSLQPTYDDVYEEQINGAYGSWSRYLAREMLKEYYISRFMGTASGSLVTLKERDNVS